MTKKKTRLLIDLLLTIMIVFEMFIQYTGQMLHEIVGFAFFITIAVHMGLSAKWIKAAASSARKKRMKGRTKVLAVMGILLALNTVVLAVSSIAISGILSSTGFVWPIGTYALWAQIHEVSSYTLCALVAIHLATHWASLTAPLKIEYSPSRRQAIATGVYAVAALGAIGLGLTAANKAVPSSATPDVDDTSSTSVSQDSTTNAAQPTQDAQLENLNDYEQPESTNEKSTEQNESSSGVPESSEPESSASMSEPSESASSAAVTGTCTLCRKNCSLSAPKCKKPYQAGLI